MIFDEFSTEWNLAIDVDVIRIVFNARFHLMNDKEKKRDDEFETSRERERETDKKISKHYVPTNPQAST